MEVIWENKEDECNSFSSTSSSIGDDSDLDREEEEEDDVESSYTFDEAIEALEQALPMRRGISNYYNGKSKSFTNLLELTTTTSSIQDIAKPENAYIRKRRNLAAFKLFKIKTKKISKKRKTTPIFTRHSTTTHSQTTYPYR